MKSFISYKMQMPTWEWSQECVKLVDSFFAYYRDLYQISKETIKKLEISE